MLRTIAISLMASASLASSVFAAPSSATENINQLQELMIVSPFVVDDARAKPGGPWHFGTLVREMLPVDASDQEVSDFVVRWLDEWTWARTVNGFPIPARPKIKDLVICPWLNASTGRSDCTGTLDMGLAPFRLTAIVNRMDVRKPGSNGEGRFAFALLAEPTSDPTDASVDAQQFTVLMNYDLPSDAGQDAGFWARQWHTLGSLPCSSSADCSSYREALETLTNRFARRGVKTGTPGGTAFLELHTNEAQLAFPWEVREFKLGKLGGRLALVSATLNKTPDASLNNQAKLVDWVKANESKILNGTYVVPTEFLGGSALESHDKKWKFDGVAEGTRFAFSSNTCNGCHRLESDRVVPIAGFYHISPFGTGTERLSDFLKNVDLPRRERDFRTLLEKF